MCFLYNSEYNSLLDFKDAKLFLHGLSRFLCVHFHFFANTLCICVMYITSFDGLFG